MSKILYAASSSAHLLAFHMPYIEALRGEGHTVITLGGGEGSDLNIAFEKKYFSRANARSRKAVKRLIEEEGFDVVIVNTSLAAFHVRRALPKENRPRLVNVVHGYLFPEFATGFRAGIKRFLLLAAEKILRKKTDAIVVMNAEDLRICVTNNLINGDPYLINGMGVPVLTPSSTPERLKAELGLEGKQLLTFIGELSSRKNQAFLIEAMRTVLASVESAHLLLVGDGAMADELSALTKRLGLEAAVTFLGRRTDIADILSATDIYVSASRSEGLPFNIVEALGAKKPIVASDVKGQSDILSGGAGILYDDGDVSAYTEAVIGLLKGSLRIDAQAMLDSYRRYSAEEVFENTYSILKEAAGL